ncbi:MAG: hypothetical protein ACYC41_08580 [Bacillota bacterium]
MPPGEETRRRYESSGRHGLPLLFWPIPPTRFPPKRRGAARRKPPRVGDSKALADIINRSLASRPEHTPITGEEAESFPSRFTRILFSGPEPIGFYNVVPEERVIRNLGLLPAYRRGFLGANFIKDAINLLFSELGPAEFYIDTAEDNRPVNAMAKYLGASPKMVLCTYIANLGREG